jgi:hypothetical protein
MDGATLNRLIDRQERVLERVLSIRRPELAAQERPKRSEQPLKFLASGGVSGPNSVEKNGPGQAFVFAHIDSFTPTRSNCQAFRA